MLLSASEDRSILAVDTATASPLARHPDAHAKGVECVRFLSTHHLVSADEDGHMAFWDTRQRACIGTMRPHTDYVHDMTLHARDDLLAAVSADGRLSKIDPRQRKVLQISEGDPDDELLCVAVVKGGHKVVAGSTTGVIDVFTWKDICDCSDRWPGAFGDLEDGEEQRTQHAHMHAQHTGHLDQVDAVVAFDDDTIITGCNDGMIRVLALQPNRFLYLVGAHPGELGVEALALGPGKRLLASVSQDEEAYVWSLDALHDDDEGEEEGKSDEVCVGRGNGVRCVLWREGEF